MEKKKRFKMPHAYVIIFIMTVITAILANIIPAGTFDRVEDASGNSVVVADSFHHVDKIGCSIFDMFKSFQIGFEDSAQIIFFIIFAYAFVYVLLKNGTFDALVGSVLRKVGNRIELIIPVCMILFGLLGSTMGMFEETYGLIPVYLHRHGTRIRCHRRRQCHLPRCRSRICRCNHQPIYYWYRPGSCRREDVLRSWLPYSLLCRIHGHQYLVCMALCT